MKKCEKSCFSASTQSNHCHLNNISTGKVGRPSVLTHAEESLIVHALQKLGDWGFGLDDRLYSPLTIVQEYLINAGKPNPFKDGKPGIFPTFTCHFAKFRSSPRQVFLIL